MIRNNVPASASLTPEERLRRRKYLGATVITCIAAAMVFGIVHVVQLGSKRMDDMRARATYDLKEEHLRIRAAGEDIVRHQSHQGGENVTTGYALEQIEALLSPEVWAELAREVAIPAGEFTMGTDSERADAQDQPAHSVNLPAYRIDKYPVTQAEYARFVVKTGRRPPLNWDDGAIPEGQVTHPVTMVSWYDAKSYCEWEQKRLPTEAEWEKAARGPDGERWPWGNQMDAQRLNTYYNIGSTTPVDRFPAGASRYGVFDMAGNVSEWTSSDFKPYPNSKAAAEIFQPKVTTATDPADERMKVAELVPVDNVIYKVRRGGSWKSDPFSTANYHRNFSMPFYASDFFGFRCARDAGQGE